MTDTFNRENIFREKLEALTTELSELCKKNSMPFFWTICVENSEDGTRYISDGASAPGRGIKLKDDKISKHLAVVMGFDVTRPMEEIDERFLISGGIDEEGLEYPEIGF